MQLSDHTIKAFQKKILSWYQQHKRSLPWRDMSDDISLQKRAYRILVSEVMSQQTQIQRVVLKYQTWMEKFPTIDSLAAASVADVLQYWSGLGYNRRALNLKKIAEILVREHGEVFPQEEKMLLQLPGIGAYTARAVLCFAFGKQVAVVDTNVRKVILTEVFFRHREPERRGDLKEIASSQKLFAMTDREIEAIADQLLPEGRAYEWNQALMDYAAAVLKKERIPIPKQSKFIGSHRYYRGQLVKVLLEKRKIPIKDLGIFIKKDYDSHEIQWLSGLINELKNEGFIVVKQENVLLSS